MAVRGWCSLLACLTLWMGCDAAPQEPQEPQEARDAGADDASIIDACEAASPVAPLSSVSAVVDHLNTLPNPVTLPCLLKSLPRPLAVHATRSVFSAQPAVGTRSPRIFIFFDQLVLSIALAGMGKDLLEFGEHRPDARSLKAEIAFPVEGKLTHSAPFERVLYKEGQTSCAFCHAAESRDDTVAFTEAFVSAAYQPARSQDYVSVAELAAELHACDAQAEPARCATLESLFAGGPPQERAFPPEYAKFQ